MSNKLEMVDVEEIPFLRESIRGLFDTDQKDDVSKEQLYMIHNKLAFCLPDEGEAPFELTTMKAYAQLWMNQDPEHPDWDGQLGKELKYERPSEDLPPDEAGGLEAIENEEQLNAEIAAGVEAALPVTPVVTPEEELPFTPDNAVPNQADIEAMEGPDEPDEYNPVSIDLEPVATVATPAQPAAPVRPMSKSMVPPNVSKPQAPELNAHGLTDNQVAHIVNGLYYKMKDLFFPHCMPFKPAPGTVAEGDVVAFAKPEAVAEIGIPLTEMEQKVIHRCDCLDRYGKYHKATTIEDGVLRGFITLKDKLPAFKIYFMHEGVEKRRFIIPQNCNKRIQNNPALDYSTMAQQARAGAEIIWISDSNEASRNSNNNMLLKFVNGELSKCDR
jgi:hypothetical protein